jgi:hypothetical protein
MLNGFVNMKIILILFLCSYASGNCLPPYEWPEKYDDTYDCMVEGYKKSSEKLAEIGREDVNKEGLFIRFACIEEVKVET